MYIGKMITLAENQQKTPTNYKKYTKSSFEALYLLYYDT